MVTLLWKKLLCCPDRSRCEAGKAYPNQRSQTSALTLPKKRNKIGQCTKSDHEPRSTRASDRQTLSHNPASGTEATWHEKGSASVVRLRLRLEPIRAAAPRRIASGSGFHPLSPTFTFPTLARCFGQKLPAAGENSA